MKGFWDHMGRAIWAMLEFGCGLVNSGKLLKDFKAIERGCIE